MAETSFKPGLHDQGRGGSVELLTLSDKECAVFQVPYIPLSSHVSLPVVLPYTDGDSEAHSGDTRDPKAQTG